MAIEQIDGFAARLSWPRGVRTRFHVNRGFAAEYRLVQYEKCIANKVCIFQMAHVSVSSHRFIRVVERCQESCMCKRRISLTVAKNKGWVGFCRLLGTTLGGAKLASIMRWHPVIWGYITHMESARFVSAYVVNARSISNKSDLFSGVVVREVSDASISLPSNCVLMHFAGTAAWTIELGCVPFSGTKPASAAASVPVSSGRVARFFAAFHQMYTRTYNNPVRRHRYFILLKCAQLCSDAPRNLRSACCEGSFIDVGGANPKPCAQPPLVNVNVICKLVEFVACLTCRSVRPFAMCLEP